MLQPTERAPDVGEQQNARLTQTAARQEVPTINFTKVFEPLPRDVCIYCVATVWPHVYYTYIRRKLQTSVSLSLLYVIALWGAQPL